MRISDWSSDVCSSDLIGAMGEMQDNVYEHSGAAHTGLVAYAVTDCSFEFVVADRGMGVLETLRQNPDYEHLPDAGAALRSEERRVGKTCVSTCRSRWWP